VEEDGCCASTWDGSALGSGGGESRDARVRIALQLKQAAKKMSANLRREILHAQSLAMAQRPGDGDGSSSSSKPHDGSCCPHVDEHVVDETLLRLGAEMPHPFSKLLEAVAATSPSWSRLLDRILGAAEEKLAACIVARDLLQEAHWPLSLGQRRVREDQCIELDKLRMQHREARQRICDLDAHVVRLERRISRYRDQLRSAENALDGCQCTQRSGSISSSMKARETADSMPNLPAAPSSVHHRSGRNVGAGAGALSDVVAKTAAAAGLATAAAAAAAAAAMDGDTAPLATPSDRAATATTAADFTAANGLPVEPGAVLQQPTSGCGSAGSAHSLEQQDSAPPRCTNQGVAAVSDAAARLTSVSRRRRATSLSPLPPNVRTVQISLAGEEDRGSAAHRETHAATSSNCAGGATTFSAHADTSPGPGPLLETGSSRRGGERRGGRRSAASAAVWGGAARTPSGRGTRGRLTMGEHSSSYTRLPGSNCSSTGPASGSACSSGAACSTAAAYPHAKSLLRSGGSATSNATSAAPPPPASAAASCEALSSVESPHRSHFQQVVQPGLSPASAVTAGARVPAQMQRTPPSSGIRKSASGKRQTSASDVVAAPAAASAGSSGSRSTAATLPKSLGPMGGGSRSGCSLTSTTSSIRYPASRSTAAVQQQQGQPPGPWAVVLGAQVQQSSPGSMVASSTPVSASLSPAAVSPMALAGQVSSPLRKRCHVASSATLQAPSAWRHH